MAWLLSAACLGLLAHVSAANLKLDLLSEGATAWGVPGRVGRCPVHSEVKAVQDNGVKFVLTPAGEGRPKFSLVEMTSKSLADSDGLHVKYSSTGIEPWKIRLDTDAGNVRFVSVIDLPDGSHSIFVPWEVFRGEKLRPGGIDLCTSSEACFRVDAASIKRIAVIVYASADHSSPELTLHTLNATLQHEDLGLSAQAESWSQDSKPIDFAEYHKRMGSSGEDMQSSSPLDQPKLSNAHLQTPTRALSWWAVILIAPFFAIFSFKP
eukprot:TRINITY_DN14071_c0_g1_i2.p1 TRINITY_DN14071_c0_g1~~TRINITY_DN14071_c0_g1_i2.p1  ORF type:complete len:265 (-),score=46.71 TRINITY_DN14071_c0_g1_i2:19-813(-)